MALPAGGWAVIGAADTVVQTLGTRSVDNLPACAIVDGSLEAQRQMGVWSNQLSIFERMHWESHHPGEQWLVPRTAPPRSGTYITPLAVGEERKIGVMNDIPDSNEIVVLRKAENEFVGIVDIPVERGTSKGRVRRENDDITARIIRRAVCMTST